MPHRRPAAGQPSAPAARAAVVGAGVAGLVAARELAALGFAVDVFEAGPRPGGPVAPHTIDDLVLDAGADSFATRNTAVADLAAELGLGDAIATPRPGGAWLYAPDARGGAKARPLPQTGVLGIPGDPEARDVREALGPDGAARAARDLADPVDPALAREPISLGALVRARLGGAALERLVAPVVAGVHSADPDTLDADAVAPGLREAMLRHGSLCRAAAAQRAAAPAGSAVAGITGGMHRLTAALVADLADRGAALHLRAPVSGLERDGGDWAVAAPGASGPYRRVVVATDGPSAVDLLAPLRPGLGDLRPAPGAGVALVTLVVDRPELDEAPRGTGVLVAPGTPGITAKALTHATAKWEWLADEAGPGTHVLRLSYGRLSGADSVLADADDATLIASALADAGTLLGVPVGAEDLLGSDVVRHRAALPFAATGHRDRVAAFRGALAELPGIDAVGAWLSGTGLAAVVADARARTAVSAT